MDYIGVTEDKDKVTLLKNWGGSELTEFMRTSAKAKLEVKGEEDADQYDEIVRKTREEMKRLVNRKNIDNTPRNPGIKHTQYHIQTPQKFDTN